MGITTGSGDQGQTDLWSGERVAKDDMRIEACGTVDELQSWISLCCHEISNEGSTILLNQIQKNLFRVAGQLATAGKIFDDPITEEDSNFLRDTIEKKEKLLDLTGFILPGQTAAAAHLDIARTVARRAERRTCTVYTQSPEPQIKDSLVYLNRVSDLLFILARQEENANNTIKHLEH